MPEVPRFRPKPIPRPSFPIHETIFIKRQLLGANTWRLRRKVDNRHWDRYVTALETINAWQRPRLPGNRLRLKCDGTRAETRFRLSAKRTSPFKSAGASVQSTTGSQGVRISGSNAEYTMFRGSVKGTGYPLHSPVSPSLPLPCVTVCHHNSTGLYHIVIPRLLHDSKHKWTEMWMHVIEARTPDFQTDWLTQ